MILDDDRATLVVQLRTTSDVHFSDEGADKDTVRNTPKHSTSFLFRVYRSYLGSFRSGRLNPARGVDGASSDPLVDWDRVRYAVPLFIPLDAFGVLVKGGPKTENYGDSLDGVWSTKVSSGSRNEAPAGV